MPFLPRQKLYIFQLDSDSEITSEDPRLEYIQDFMVSKLKVRVDKWRKAIIQDETRRVLQQFFNQPSMWFLVVSAPVSFNNTLKQHYFVFVVVDFDVVYLSFFTGWRRDLKRIYINGYPDKKIHTQSRIKMRLRESGIPFRISPE